MYGRISIVVPSFNRPDRLAGCLEALMALDGPDHDIIVVDDGSPSPLAPVVERFGPKARCLRQDNQGPGAARNAGARASDAEFILFTDDDCHPHKDWLVKTLEAHDGHDSRLIGGRVRNALPDNVYSSASQSLCDFLYEYFGADEGDAPFFTSNNIACSRRWFEKIGGFDETFPLAAAEDRDFGMRWRDAGGELVFARDAIVDHGHDLSFKRFWRQHSNYGRGARHLHRVMNKRGENRPKLEALRFYASLVMHPLYDRQPAPLRRAALMALSQAAMARGYFLEKGAETRNG